MAYLSRIIPLVVLQVLFISCTGDHLITNKEYRGNTEKVFAERKELASNRSHELFDVFDGDLTTEQEEALKFLYAYMPLSDLADYSGEFFLAQADRALKAWRRSKWEKEIPEEIFLHYILPYRVNNENLDSFRIVYFDEIQDRIKDLDQEKSVLEINYWSHEKVAYQPADIRTSSPMHTILSARGRCGEESTLTVSALRTAGIPARQVYTPRWAHTDDNHAWVEIWMKGKWYYMGACEPEQVLDRGWFTEFARRAMLVHTKSFGAPYGTGNVINLHRNYSEVNNLKKYAETKRLYVRVLDSNGMPADGASVEYRLYNYSEFYPLTTVPADNRGMSSLETGFGDLMIWADKNDKFAWKIISVSETDTLQLTLGYNERKNYSVEADLYIPPVLPPYPGLSEEYVRKNAERLEKGNLIRNSYINSWISDAEIRSVAATLNADTARIRNIFQRSMGNFTRVRNLLLSVPDSLRERAYSLLEVLPDKDLRDSKESVLLDHIVNSRNSGVPPRIFTDYVLNARIDNELMVAWRSYFLNHLKPDIIKEAGSKPDMIRAYLEKNIRINNDENYYGTPLTPVGVYELKVSDQHSRAICFIAICRSLGIPSRFEPGRNIPQYWSDNIWYDIYFSDQPEDTGEKGFIRFRTVQLNPEPQYYTNFTLARFENGRYNTLDYEFGKKISGFPELELPAGSYMLVTGYRPDDKIILSTITFFELSKGEHKKVDVNLRSAEKSLAVLGSADLTPIIRSCRKDNDFQESADKSSVIIWFEPDQEPSRHIFNDLPAFKKELDSWGGNFLFLSEKKIPGNFRELPEHSYFSDDPDLKLLKQSVKMKDTFQIKLPIVIVVDNSGKITFMSSGYRIGIGEQILRKIQ